MKCLAVFASFVIPLGIGGPRSPLRATCLSVATPTNHSPVHRPGTNTFPNVKLSRGIFILFSAEWYAFRFIWLQTRPSATLGVAKCQVFVLLSGKAGD